jgi:type III pantothenate kinase
MLLALDVGNTNTVLGLYSLASALKPSSPDSSRNAPGTLVAHWRVSTHRTQTADEYGVLFTNLFNLHGLATTQVHHIIISSVVPPVESTLLQVCESYFKIKPLFVEPGIKTGMPVLVDNPAELGADRLVNAIAAYEKYGAASKGPVIVVDFGTATTFDVISSKGEYLGGIISPGLGISADALFSRAARLGRVDIKRPPKVIGTTTVTHIQSGLYYGYIGLVDGILERMIAEMVEDPRCGSATPKILATGGLATLIAGDSRYISTIDDMLTLEGLRLVFARNRPEQAGAGSEITGKPSRPRKRSN